MSVEIISVGRVNVDVSIEVDQLPEQNKHIIGHSGFISFGGSAANFASQLAKLGVKCGLVSCIGNDFHGQTILKELSRIGVDTKPILILEKQKTGIFVVFRDSKGNRQIVADPGANRFLDKHTLEAAQFDQAGIIHLAGGFPMMARQLAEKATVDGLIFSLDPGRKADQIEFSEVLPKTDLLFVNQAELKRYFKVENEKSKLKAFAKTFPGILILKLGENGAIATDGFEYCVSKAFPVRPVDTLGAGDSFAAGFITAWTRSERIEQALNMANATAALTIQHQGAHEGQPNLTETSSFLEDVRVSIDPVLRTFGSLRHRRKR